MLLQWELSLQSHMCLYSFTFPDMTNSVIIVVISSFQASVCHSQPEKYTVQQHFLFSS